MAVDWSKQISFSGLTKRKPKAAAEYPSKTYMNLMVQEKKTIDTGRLIPIAVVVVIVAALFIKFGVFDFYARVADKQAELNTTKSAVAAMQSKLTEYNAVLAEYEAYESTRIGDDGTKVNALDALALVDRYISPSARVSSVVLEGNTLAVTLADVSLDSLGKLSSLLNEQPMVVSVSVSTAASETGDANAVAASMVIELQNV